MPMWGNRVSMWVPPDAAPQANGYMNGTNYEETPMRTATATPDYYLVQRMNSRTNAPAGKKGVDAAFELSYMGSSEFEWGAVPKSLSAMREHAVIVSEQPIMLDGRRRSVFFVTHADAVKPAVSGFEKWVSAGYPGKEIAYFQEAAVSGRGGVDSWWSIGDGVAFFLDAKLAQRFADAVNPKFAR